MNAGSDLRQLEIYEVVVTDQVVGFFLDFGPARSFASLWNAKHATDLVQSHVRRKQVDVYQIKGTIKGNFDSGETCHVVFQFPCGKWSSEDFVDKDQSKYLVTCGCHQCRSHRVYSVVQL